MSAFPFRAGAPARALVIRFLAVALSAAALTSSVALHAQEPAARQDHGNSGTATQHAAEHAHRDDERPQLRLVDVSLDVTFAAGSSTVRDDVLRVLQGGGHDPRRRGFTVQNVALGLTAAFDPWLVAEAHVVYLVDPDGESELELEEALVATQSLPYGLHVEAGQLLTEFGRLNPQHPHAWNWLDQPVILTRVFGADGMRGPGLRLAWRPSLPWHAELSAGAQNANGETMTSFLSNEEAFAEQPIGGRPFVDREVRNAGDLAWLLRVVNEFDLSAAWSLSAGGSVVHGPNATGAGADTLIWGADVALEWRPAARCHSWPFFSLQGEIVGRRYDTAPALVENDPATTADDVLLPRDELRDVGAYVQALHGFHHDWAAGLRYEWARGSGVGFDARGAPAPRALDPFRNERHRLAPLLVWQPNEWARLRLQYNFDHAEHLAGDTAHSVWFGVEATIGRHAAHDH